jgi:gephyrin
LNFATAGRTLVFGLPGNPVSALVGFELFVHTALKVMTGRKDARPRFVPVRIDQTITSGDRPEFQRSVVWVDETGVLRARNTGSQSSARLMSFVGANALVLISPRKEPYQIGEQVPAIIVGPIANAPDRR